MLASALNRLRWRLRWVEGLAAALRWGAWGGLAGVLLAALLPSRPLWLYALPSLGVGVLAAAIVATRRRPASLLAEVADAALRRGALFQTALELPPASPWGASVHAQAEDAAGALVARRAVPWRLGHARWLLGVLLLAAGVSRAIPLLPRWQPARPGAAPVEVDSGDLGALHALSGRLARAADDQRNAALHQASARLVELERDLEAQPLGELELLARLGGVRDVLDAERRRVAGRAAVRRILERAPGLEQLVREGRAPTAPETPAERQALQDALEAAASQAGDPELARALREVASTLEEDTAAALGELERTLAQLPARYVDERTGDELRRSGAALEELREAFGAPPPEPLDPEALAERLDAASPEELEAWTEGEAPRDPELASALDALDPTERREVLERALAQARPAGDAAAVESRLSPPQDGEPVAEGSAPQDGGELPVAEGSAPRDGEQPQDGGEPPVAEGTPLQDGGEPQGGEHPQDGGEPPVAEGTPPQDGEQPRDGEQPSDGGEQPVAEGSAPRDGEQPQDGGEQPVAEGTPPQDGGQPQDGEQPQGGEQPPDGSEQPVAEGEQPQDAGEQPPREDPVADRPPQRDPLGRTDRPPPDRSLADSLLDSPLARSLAEELLQTVDKETLKDLMELARDANAGEPPQLPDEVPPGLSEKLAQLDPEVLKKVAEAASELSPPDTPPNVPPGLAEELRNADPKLLEQLAELIPPRPPRDGSAPGSPRPAAGGTRPDAPTGAPPPTGAGTRPDHARPAGSGAAAGGSVAGGQPGESGDASPVAGASAPAEGEASGVAGAGGTGNGGGTAPEPGDVEPLPEGVTERLADLDPDLRRRVEQWIERHPRRIGRRAALVGFDPGREVNLEGVERAMEQQRVPASYEGVVREYFRRDPEGEAQEGR
ncbi:MAG: hypothetical protein R3F62_05095 [Planctomycetota bacterium]